MLINVSNSILVVIDVQDKLINSIHENSIIVENISKLINIFNTLSLPVIYSEQYPKGLGITVDKIKEKLKDNSELVIKNNFSCWKEKSFVKLLSSKNKKQILVCGIETHICILQTALDLVKNKFTTFVIKDAVGSRQHDNHKEGINRMREESVKIVTLEMVLFELLNNSKHENFKELSSLIK